METMKCEHDWVDGACGATAPLGTPGWERRIGRKGDEFWLCPESAAQFPRSVEGLAHRARAEAEADELRRYDDTDRVADLLVELANALTQRYPSEHGGGA